MDKKNFYDSEFDNPIEYTILVRGKILPGASCRIEEMTISHQSLEDGSIITVLKGQLADQAALNGVINAIYELHLPLISVRKLS